MLFIFLKIDLANETIGVIADESTITLETEVSDDAFSTTLNKKKKND